MKSRQRTSRDSNDIVKLIKRWVSRSSKEYRDSVKDIESGPHPPPDVLFEFALNRLPKPEHDKLSKHIVFCSFCESRVFEIQSAERHFQRMLEKAEAGWPSWKDLLREISTEVSLSVRAFVRRFTHEILDAPCPALTSWLTTVPSTTNQYRRLESRLVETEGYSQGEEVTLEIEVPGDGYLSAFLFSEGGFSKVILPTGPDDDCYVPSVEPVQTRFRPPENPGWYDLFLFWTKEDLLYPEEIAYDDLDNCEELFGFAQDLIELGHEELATGRFEFPVQERPGRFEGFGPGSKIFAVRAYDSKSIDSSYWVPLLFRQLLDGCARFGWSHFDGADLRRLGEKHRQGPMNGVETDCWKRSKRLLELRQGDFLIFVNMPSVHECSVVELTGQYLFTDVWDPENRGDYRHLLPCRYRGTFDRNDPIIHPEICKRLKLKGALWSLDNVRDEVSQLLASFSE